MEAKSPPPLVPKGRQETQRDQFMLALRGLLVLVHLTTGLHPWLQHAVPSGLTRSRPFATQFHESLLRVASATPPPYRSHSGFVFDYGTEKADPKTLGDLEAHQVRFFPACFRLYSSDANADS